MRLGGLLESKGGLATVAPVRVAAGQQGGFGNPHAVFILTKLHFREWNDHNGSGMNEFLPHTRFTHERKVAGGLALKIKFNRLLQIGHGFLPRGSEAGHVHVQALGNKKFVLPVNDVVHLFHNMNLSATAEDCNHA